MPQSILYLGGILGLAKIPNINLRGRTGLLWPLRTTELSCQHVSALIFKSLNKVSGIPQGWKYVSLHLKTVKDTNKELERTYLSLSKHQEIIPSQGKNKYIAVMLGKTSGGNHNNHDFNYTNEKQMVDQG